MNEKEFEAILERVLKGDKDAKSSIKDRRWLMDNLYIVRMQLEESKERESRATNLNGWLEREKGNLITERDALLHKLRLRDLERQT